MALVIVTHLAKKVNFFTGRVDTIDTLQVEIFLRQLSLEYKGLGIRESNPICLSFEKLKSFRLVVLARRQPFFVLRTENSNNFSKWKVEEFK